MTAKDIISFNKFTQNLHPQASVDAEKPVLEVLSALLESPTHELSVMEEGKCIGIIDSDSMLDGLGRIIAPRGDCSMITVECLPEDYSASILANAVEDTDAHLVDLFSFPAENGKIRVSLRIRNSDPSSAIRSLERHDFNVVEAHPSSEAMQSLEIAAERLLSLQTLMNV